MPRPIFLVTSFRRTPSPERGAPDSPLVATLRLGNVSGRLYALAPDHAGIADATLARVMDRADAAGQAPSPAANVTPLRRTK